MLEIQIIVYGKFFPHMIILYENSFVENQISIWAQNLTQNFQIFKTVFDYMQQEGTILPKQ